MTGCDFMDAGKTQVVLEPGTEAALIYGNRLRGVEKIINRAGPCAQMAMNVVSKA